MFANRMFHIAETLLAWPVGPLQLITTSVLGLLVSLTYGAVLVPINLIYVLMWGVLVALSWACTKIQALRNPIGVLGLPLALLANTYVCLMPSMGESESRAARLLFTRSWPFCWEFVAFERGRLDIDSAEAEPLRRVMALAIDRRDLLSQRVLDRMARREPPDFKA